MKIFVTILILLCVHTLAFAQSISEPSGELNANQLEESAEDEESETENDYEAQQLLYFTKHPVDINGNDLDQLPMINQVLMNNLSAYRKLLGDLIDIHELQAVPGYTIDVIRSILPYVTVNKDELSFTDIHQRFTKGEHSLLLRPTVTPEVANGFKATSDQRFMGSRAALLLRYKYQFRNLLQYNFITDKDPGEKMFVNGPRPDFISYHLFARKLGHHVKTLALGDYTINVGQGLIHWQSQAFRKSSSVINIKRQSETLRPYHSAGEYNFHRGIATTISKRSSELTLFASRQKLTANVEEGMITSIITSGLHRTSAELNDKNTAALSAAGIMFKQKINLAQVGINAIYYSYSLPLLKRDEPYNLYSIKGKRWYNYSADYSFTVSNTHFFGELAADKNKKIAVINGMMSSVSKSVDVSNVFRYISKSFQSVYGNAFTENTTPVNEIGFYTGFSIKPHIKWRIDIYADMFSFPWLKYRLDAPLSGFAYLVQIIWKPDKQTEIYSRFRYRMKPLNIEDEETSFTIPGVQAIQHWRTHISRQLNRTILLRSRVEVCLFNHRYLTSPAGGYLFFLDIVFKPPRSWLSGNMRLQAFEADNYDTRIYAYENDLLFVSSTPSFYNNGVRCYTNLKAKAKVKILSNSALTLNLKLATTVYNNITSIGTGPMKIPHNRVSAIKLQVFLSQ